VLSTSLYFVVFGAAIGSRIDEVEGVSYGAFIVPGLIMLTVLTAGDQQRVLRDLLPEIHGHDLRAAVGTGVVRRDRDSGYVGAAATKALMIGLIILAPAFFFVDFEIAHPVWMLAFLVLTCSASACSASSSASGRRTSSSCSWCRCW
jgi:ABC-2 type transport system permease protein